MNKFIRDKNCAFCQGMDDKSITSNFKTLFPDLAPKTQILAENEYWYVIPDDSPIRKHHLLLISKNHAHSLANLDDNSANSLHAIRSEMSRFLLSQNRESDTFFFEHGSGIMEDGRPIHCGACSAHVHAHIHIIPFKKLETLNLINFLNKRIGNIMNKQPIRLELNQIPEKSNDPYLYIASNSSGAFLYPTDLKNACLAIPSQYIRSLMGEFLQLDSTEWDYKVMFDQNNQLAKQRIRETLSLFRNFGSR